MVANVNSVWASMKYDETAKKPADKHSENNTLTTFLQRLHPSVCFCGQTGEYRLGGFGFGAAKVADISLDELMPKIIRDIDPEGAAEKQQEPHQSPNKKRMHSVIQIMEDRKVALEQLYQLSCIKDKR